MPREVPHYSKHEDDPNYPYSLEPVGLEHVLTGASSFERRLQGKRRLRTFHVECGVTKRRVCYCPNNASMQGTKETRVQSMLIASDLLNYFEGNEPDLEDRL